MKILIITLISLIYIYQKTNSQKIIYFKLTEETRGFQRSILVEKDRILYIENDDELVLKNRKKDWENLKLLTKKINLNNLNTFRSNSKKRASDGALHSVLEINSVGKSYFSKTFDDSNPPKELNEVVREIKKWIPKD